MCAAVLALLAPPALSAAPLSKEARPADLAIPRYDRVFVIVEENHSYASIVDAKEAPNLTALAKTYGNATRFYAETHPSEPNYVALFSGSTYGITNDASFTINSIDAPNLSTQLEARGLTWGGYFGGYDAAKPMATYTAEDYASKHNPFMNFTTLRSKAGFTAHLHGLEALSTDLRAGSVPNFAFVVPGQCDDMHGVGGKCKDGETNVGHADEVAKNIVDTIQHSKYWNSAQNVAIVVTWDENDGFHRFSGPQGCCGTLPGGGQIPTIVITNHGARGLVDDTPYNHYSLLRTLEDAFGIYVYLGNAGNWAGGIRPMSRLFAVKE
jgi:phosphatidylinositol-3-phosphatase